MGILNRRKKLPILNRRKKFLYRRFVTLAKYERPSKRSMFVDASGARLSKKEARELIKSDRKIFVITEDVWRDMFGLIYGNEYWKT